MGRFLKLIILGGCFFCGSLPAHQKDVESVPITLYELKRFSPRAFVGIVTSIRPLKERALNEEGKQEIPVTEVLFELVEPVHGEFKGKVFKVKQYTESLSPIKKGEKVLWFLSKENSYGISVPLGYKSGHFKIFKNPIYSREVVQSLNGNENLWCDHSPFWECAEDYCSRHLFIELLRKREIPEEEIIEFLKLADSPYKPRPLPLDFLIPLAQSCKTE